MSKNNHRLSPEDWDLLDDLLGKHDFGGYYDLVECLKMSVQNMLKALGRDKEVLPEIKDLPTVVAVINSLSVQLKNRKV